MSSITRQQQADLAKDANETRLVPLPREAIPNGGRD